MNTHSENDIAKVLTGLRDTQPSTGLEQRILHGIQHRAPARPPLFMRWQLIAAVPAAALAIFLTIHILTSNNSLPTAPTTASTPTTATGTTTAAGGPSFALSAKGGVSSNARPLSSTPSETLSSRPERSAVERPAALAQLSAADRRALEDTTAPSHPAPALPLSRDERILAAAAQRGGAIEIAQLDSLPENPSRAAATAREDATVQQALHRLIQQLAAAEALNPTPPPETPDPPIPTDSSTPSN